MYRRGSDSKVEYPSGALEESTNRNTSKAAPPDRSEAIRSEGKTTRTKISRDYWSRNFPGTTGYEIKKQGDIPKYKKHHTNS